MRQAALWLPWGEGEVKVTTRELLYFGGSVLGPALIARELAELLRAVPARLGVQSGDPTLEFERGIGEALRKAFPRGLDL